MTSQDQSSSRKRGRGRPTKFREEYIEQVRALSKAGVRDEGIAAYLGVSCRSLHRWQERWPQFFEARELKHDRKTPNRPRRFRHELCERARRLYALGFTNIQVAKLMGFHLSTFDRWRREYPEFGKAVKAGRAERSLSPEWGSHATRTEATDRRTHLHGGRTSAKATQLDQRESPANGERRSF